MSASGDFFRYPIDGGCLSGNDGVIDQRPYHRNCKCQLHNNKSRKHNCPNGNSGSIVSYPIRRSWSEGCLALSSLSSPASSSSPSAAAPPPISGKKKRQGSAIEEDDLFPRINSGN